MPISESTRIVAEPGILSAMSGDELVLMDAESGEYYTFEGAGGDIWQLLETPIQVSDLCQRLIEGFDAPDAEIRASTLEFLQGLLERKLIRTA